MVNHMVGHLAPVIAQENEKQVDALVTEGAFSSFKDMAQAQLGIVGRVIIHQQYSAKQSIKKFHKPVLIIHSTEDKTIPYHMGKTLFAAANRPKSFYEIQHEHIRGPIYYADSIVNGINTIIK